MIKCQNYVAKKDVSCPLKTCILIINYNKKLFSAFNTWPLIDLFYKFSSMNSIILLLGGWEGQTAIGSLEAISLSQLIKKIFRCVVKN